ncbi:MAG: HYR domain-containing protein [Saprospiraceae bacterium]|nr:HYR domain-containing protein [Saprospiraceae bacterium]
MGGNFTITNSQCTFDTYLATLNVTGNFLLETKKVTWTSEYPVNITGNYAIENSNSAINITSSGSLNVRGNFKLHPTCTYSVYLTNFNATTTGKTIDPAGKIFTYVNFSGSGGAWTMLNDFTCTADVNHSFGTFISNGYKVDYGLGLNANYANVLGLNYTGTDTVRSKSYFTLSSSANTTLTIASAVIKINTANNNYNISFNGGGKTFNDVYLIQSGLSYANNISLSGVNTRFEKLYLQLDRNGTVNFNNNTLYYKDVFVNYRSASASTANVNISGANTWFDLKVTSPKVLLTTTISAANTFDTLSMPNGTSFTFQSSVTQNWNAFVANGLCDNIPIYKSSSAGTQATLNDLNGGTTMISFINLKDIRVTGGTWNASNVIDSGNNTGINITAAPSVTYYWIGGTGSWTDPTHWSLSSGGTASSCLPSQYDDVVFDIFSFTANGQSVTVSGTITVRNMTWTSGVNRNPTFNPTTLNVTGDLKILGQVNINSSTTVNAGGDFILNQNITWSNLTALNYVSDSLNNAINFGGKSFFCPVLFNSISPAITPQWTLANAFTITNSSSGTTFSKGNFISNGYNVNFGRIFQASLGTAVRNLNFTGSAEVRAGHEWRISTNVNTTLNMGTSKLILDYNAAYITINFYGGNKTYQEVEILKYISYNNGNHVNIYDNNTLSILNVRWLNSSDDNLVIHGTQNIGTLNIIEEPNPYYFVEIYVNSNNNQIGTFNITKRGSYDTYVYINGTGQNITNYNVTQSGTAAINSNFQTGTHTISNVNIAATSSGAINTTFSGGAHNIGNLNLTSAGGSITTNMNGTNAVYGNYTSSTTGSGTNTLSLNNALTTADITMQSVNGNSRLVSQTGNKTHGKVKITTTGSGIPDPEFYVNSSLNRLELSEGFDMYIGSNTNVSITNEFVSFSSCAKQSRIIGASQSTSKITKLSGNVNLNYGLLQTHIVTGGAVFNATNTVNTSTTGWTSSAEPPLTYYWIGGSGSWSEISHWSLTSGGVSNGCKIPEPEDNVVFDQNSFTAINQFVTLNVSATVNNMQWSGALYNPGFGFTNIYGNPVNLTVNGNLVINDQMRWQWVRSYYGYANYLNLKGSIKLNSNVTWAHDNYVNFNTSPGSFEADMAGKIFQDNVYFNGATGSQLTLLSNFTVNPLYTTNFTTGKFVSNGYDVDFGKRFLANNGSAKELDFSNTNTVRVRELWEINTSASNVLNMGAATLLMQSNSGISFTFNGGNKTYSDVTVQHDNTSNYTITISGNNIFDDFSVGYINRKDVTINGNNTFGSFTISQNYDLTNNIPLLQVNGNNLFGTFVILSLGVQGPQATFAAANTFGNFISVGRNTRIRFAANITQTLTGPVQVLGTGGQPIYMQSTVIGTRATLTRADDNMCFDYIWIQDINATGGATYLGGINGKDLGNNVGIIFDDNCVGYYWVGGSGNWSDVNHWATASGGNNKHLVPPTQVDHVFFDANSFTAAGQTVNLNVSGICANMDWLSSLFNPTFSGSADSLSIYGSLTLSPNLNLNWQGNWYLKGDTEIETVDLKGKTLTNLIFDANQSTGGYNILQPIAVTDTLIISDGLITTNNQAISAKTFIINSPNTKTLNLGSSTITLTEGGWDVQNSSAITLNAGTSTIDLKSNAGDVLFYGGNLTYNNVKFTATTTMDGSVFGSNTYNTLTAGGSTHLTLESGKTQTAANFNLSGKCLNNLTIDASVPGTPTSLSKSSGTVNSLFLDLTDVHAIGGATFNATFSIDNGNNNGWNFPSTTVLDANLTANNPSCPVPNNGSITANIIGGLSPYTYQWSNLSATQTISNLSAGTYAVTVTDNAGCSVTKSETITQPSTYGYIASATGSTVCFGASTGTVSVSAPLGATPLSYLWNNGASSGTQMNVPAGIYAVTVTDANGCLATASTIVNSYPQLTASYTNTTANCKDVAMTFTGLPNTAGYLYGWNFGNGNNAATRVANNTFTATGNYAVVLTVADLNGCTDTESKQITIVNPPSVTATTVSTTTCVSCNGFANLNIINGTSPYTIVNNTPVSNLCAGNYAYQIRDANQCLSTQETFTVSLNDLTKPSISGLTNKTAVVNTGCTATGISLGTPVVTDDCSSTANIVVTNNAPVSGIYPIGVTTVFWTATDQAMNVQTFSQNVTVNAADINLIGNSMGITNGDTIPSVNDNTDFGEINIGQNVSKTFSIQNPGTATLSLTGNPRVTLSNPAHFSVTSQPAASSITAGGTALSFTIKYMPTTAGIHLDSVTILSNDCDEAIYKFRIKGKVNCSISIDNVTVGDETCPGENDGTLTIDATCLSCATAADIRYSTDNIDFSNIDGLFENLPDGTYTVYVRDVNNVGCNANSGPHAIAAGVDNQLPSITCPSNINLSNDTGLCNAVVNHTTPVGTDNCPLPATAQIAGLSSGSAFPVGSTVNTFRVTDASGNTAVCSFTVTVADTLRPVITCPANINANNDTGLCSSVVNYTAPVGTDNCPMPTTVQTAGMTSGSAFPVGSTVNTFRVTDAAGNTAVCSFTVTVVDTLRPVITCPSNINADNDTGLCSAVINYTAPVGTDNCPMPTTVQTAGMTSGSAFPVGSTVNTFRVTDAAGNTAQCSFTVIVADTLRPAITCPSNINTDNDTGLCSSVVNYTAPVGTDNCLLPATAQIAGLLSGSAFPVGSTVNTFRVTDAAGNTAQCSFTVTVVDTLRPVITCPANINANNDTGLCSAVVNFTAPIGTDNCPSPNTIQIVGQASGSGFPVGVTTNTFRVTDASGNTAVCSFTVTVSDTLRPVITCPANITVNTDVSLCTASGVSLGMAAVSDNCNMAIITTNDATEPYIRGVNTIIWTADDGNGNINTCSQTVTVLYPEINLVGNGLTIEDGDNTTSTSDFTDFGPQTPGTHTDRVFYIQNLGSNPLILSNAPIVTISGDAEFTIHTQPSSTVINAGGGDLSFMVRYSPTSAGTHTAIVTVVNNDCDEETYTFTVSSCGTSVFYKDQDGDGYGNADSVEVACIQPPGYVANGDDCNDSYSGLNIQPVVFSHDGICYPTLEAALAVAGGNSGEEVMIHADASPNEINIVPKGVTVRVLSGTWTNHMMLKNNGLIIIESGANFINATGGVYKGRGVFNGSFQNIGGLVSPGN